MTKETIIEALARERRVEVMVENIAHQPLTAELQDLSQMVYLALLGYDEEILVDLWDNDQINFFLARIILNQYRSSTSPFYTLFRKFQDRCVLLGVGGDINEGAVDYINRTHRKEREK